MKKIAALALILSLFLSACVKAQPKPDYTLVTRNGVTATQDYFDFFDASIHHEIIIEVTQVALDELDSLMKIAYQKFGNFRISAYVKANFVYKENGQEKIRINEVGLRTHGNIFSRYLIESDGFTMNSLHWRVSFDETFDLSEDSDAYKARKKRNLFGLENLVLKWNRTSLGTPFETDPYILESYGYSLYEKAGIPSSKASLVHVLFKVGGRTIDQGVMTMIEPVDDEFIQKRFKKSDAQGDLIKALWQNAQANLESTTANLFGVKDEEKGYTPAYDLKSNEDSKGEALKVLIRQISNTSINELYDTLKLSIDLDNFNAFNAMNYLYGNPDDFRYNSNNYYLYRDSSINPKWIFIPTDLDKGLGITDWDPDGSQLKNILPFDNFTSNYTFPPPLLLRKTILSSTKAFIDPYLSTLKDQVENIFLYEDFAQAYQVAHGLYAQDSSKSQTRTHAKPMGLPDAVSKYYCVVTYKVLNQALPTNECN